MPARCSMLNTTPFANPSAALSRRKSCPTTSAGKTRATSTAPSGSKPLPDWIVGGQTLAAQGKHSVYFDIKVTDETNTKAEKAQYIAEAFEAFAALLGNLHEESYIYVQDVRAAAYGYGGKTQEYRFQHA